MCASRLHAGLTYCSCVAHACSEIRVGPCVYRQLHWHAASNESGVYAAGPPTIQEWLFAPNGTVCGAGGTQLALAANTRPCCV
jgi:hypothetical protein